MSATRQQPDISHEFDFIFGRWLVRNRRLRERLKGSDTWDNFEATCECKPILGGLGNADEFITDFWPGFIGMALRLFDLQTRQWSIYWISNRDGILQPPVVGTFSEGIGVFEGPDVWDGKPVLVRFTWSDITETSARWKQAFSPDNGQTWETNWIMDFTRQP